jgi:choline kinase
MKAIIIAAGMGRRLAPYTDDRPKCLVEVNGRSILQRQLDVYRAVGVDEVAIVRGYRKQDIQIPGARTFDNDAYRDNNILCSLFYAEPAMDDDLLISYSDIVFRPEAVHAAMAAPGDFALVIDRQWKEANEGLSDLLNDLIEGGERMSPAFIDGGWREIDTVEDLERAHRVVNWS